MNITNKTIEIPAPVYIVKDNIDDEVVGAYFDREEAIEELFPRILELDCFTEDYTDYVLGLNADECPMSRVEFLNENKDEYSDMYSLEMVLVK